MSLKLSSDKCRKLAKVAKMVSVIVMTTCNANFSTLARLQFFASKRSSLVVRRSVRTQPMSCVSVAMEQLPVTPLCRFAVNRQAFRIGRVFYRIKIRLRQPHA